MSQKKLAQQQKLPLAKLKKKKKERKESLINQFYQKQTI